MKLPRRENECPQHAGATVVHNQHYITAAEGNGCAEEEAEEEGGAKGHKREVDLERAMP